MITLKAREERYSRILERVEQLVPYLEGDACGIADAVISELETMIRDVVAEQLKVPA